MTLLAGSVLETPTAAVSRRSRESLREWQGPDLAAGLERWRQLDARLQSPPLTASYAWTVAWTRTYEGQVPFRIVTLEIDGDTAGACLITRGVGQNAGPIPLRTMHVGTAGEPLGHSVCVEYNGLLVEEGRRDQFARLLLEGPLREPGLDELRLDGWPVADLPAWSQVRTPDAVRVRDCPYFHLAAARDQGVEPIELLGKSTRQNLRRLLRKYGPLDMQWAESLEDAHDIFHELVSLHQERWRAQGQPGAFASERFQKFQEELLCQGFSEGKVVLFRVRHENETVGCLLLLVDRGRLLDYLSGFASFDRKPSPGLVTHFLCLTEAAQRNYLAYDFLVGEKRHKQNLSTETAQLAWAVWRGRTVRNRLVDGLKAVKRASAGARALCRRKPAVADSEIAEGAAS
jgi:CelD/BcsL family acetyltransferase involved in cellulose biosynthesis